MIINFKTIILLKLGFPLKCCKLLKRSSRFSILFCGTLFTIEFLCILGMWENKFEKNDTMKRTFYVSDTRSVETNFMHQVLTIILIISFNDNDDKGNDNNN